MLERWWTKGIPFVIEVEDQEPFLLRIKVLKPGEGFLFNSVAGWYRDVHRHSAPREACDEQNCITFVRPHPVGQGAAMSQPSAYELATWVVGSLIIDGAAASRAEGAFLARIDGLSPDFDLEPSFATGGAISALA